MNETIFHFQQRGRQKKIKMESGGQVKIRYGTVILPVLGQRDRVASQICWGTLIKGPLKYENNRQICMVSTIDRDQYMLTSPEFLLTASHVLAVWRYALDFTRQKSGYYGPDRCRPRDDGLKHTSPGETSAQ